MKLLSNYQAQFKNNVFSLKYLQEEFSSYDANEPFIRSLVMNLESLLGEFKLRLTPTNYDSFILIIADEVIMQLEKNILKTEFNRVSNN